MSRIPAVAVLCSLGVIAGCSEMPSEPAMPADRPAFATTYVGEQQPHVELKRGTYAIYPETAGQVVSQTFTPANSGLLSFIQMPVGCAHGVFLKVRVRKGLGGAILYEGNVAGLPLHIDGSFQVIQVYNPEDPETPDGMQVGSGRTYAFELAAIAGPDATDPTCGIAKGPAGNSYDGGRSYFREPGMPAFAPLPNALPTDDEDLPFITLMR